MKKILGVLSVIAFTFITLGLTACGGGGGGSGGGGTTGGDTTTNTTPGVTTYTIAGTTKPSTHLTLTGGSSTSKYADSSGKYSFSGLTSGVAYTVTPSFTGYTFNPVSYSVLSLDADYPSVDFVATQNSNPPPPIRGVGVRFSGTVAGFAARGDHIDDTHLVGTLGFVPGGEVNTAGGYIEWMTSPGIISTLTYDQGYNLIYVYLDATYIGGVECYLGQGGSLMAPRHIGSGSWVYPPCSEVGVTLDRVAGLITFSSTEMIRINDQNPMGITATGSLSFPSF